MTMHTTFCDVACMAASLAHVQRARLITDEGEELTAGLACLDFELLVSVVLVNLEPVAPLAQAVARGRRDFHLGLDEGITLPVVVLGSATVAAARRVCFLRVLARPSICNCADGLPEASAVVHEREKPSN